MIRLGTRVKVNVPKDKILYQVEKLNGQTFVVKRYSQCIGGKCYYELYGAESDLGVPYGFLEEWLIKVD